jgi:AraC-like DNA-binding protein
MEHRVRKVIALAEESLHKGWSPAKFAGLVNLSPSRLHQLFKEETGLPPARYLRQLRMRRAKELLETTHLSVKQVMAGVGLTDESHFVRDFKKSCGLTPARYRARFHQSAPASATPPLLLRRVSYPRQCSEPPSVNRRRELLSLLERRQAAFVELTNAATDRIVRGMPAGRSISYRPRRAGLARRLPPSAERPRTPGPSRPPKVSLTVSSAKGFRK